MFIDEARIYVKGGDGGRGCVSFRREKYVPRGGPDGGDGGDGGSVFLESSQQINTLLAFRYRSIFKGQRGRHGQGKNMHGRSGEDLVIGVPVGTVVFDVDSGEQLHDFTVPEERIPVAAGGKGGRGNSHFATATRQAPRRAEPGLPGRARNLRLELKLLADVGLVGFPNAGKSTLISRISAARPKIADYPFTTLSPVLGVVRADHDRSFVVADIPGLIQGAHRGLGLGDRFLRHVERTRVLCHLVDVSSETGRDPVEDYGVIRRELELYNPALIQKPEIVVATKMDVLQDPGRLERLDQFCHRRKLRLLRISSVRGEGLQELVRSLDRILQRSPAATESA
ncbi:MAG: GTPase ObgE [Acidobacteria bacterium]|nr:GTPase ObgE [Acidobacteriota bacterium]